MNPNSPALRLAEAPELNLPTLLGGIAVLAVAWLWIVWARRRDGLGALHLGPVCPRLRGRLLAVGLGLLTAYATVAILTYVPMVSGADSELSHSFYRVGGPPVTRVVRALSNAGGRDLLLMWLPLVVVAMVFAGWTSSLRFFVGSMLGTVGLEVFFKELIHRARPDFGRRVSWDSFPSGHALAAIILALTLGILLHARVKHPALRGTLFALFACWALFVGAARVYLGAHHALDVVGAWLLGTAWVCFCVHACLTPVVADGEEPGLGRGLVTPRPVPESAA